MSRSLSTQFTKVYRENTFISHRLTQIKDLIRWWTHQQINRGAPLARVVFALPCRQGKMYVCVRVGRASVASGWLIIFMRGGDEIPGMNV
jgi:hypothetical protein